MSGALGSMLSWTRQLGVRLELRLRLVPLALAGGIALGLLVAATHLGLSRPHALGLGPGVALIAGQLAQRWLAPLAALLVLLCGTPAMLEGLLRGRRDGLAEVLNLGLPSPAVRIGLELLTTALMLGLLAVVLAVPFSWLGLLGVLLPGTAGHLLLLLAGAVLLSTASSHLAAMTSRSFGTGLAAAMGLQAALVALLLVVVH